MDSVTKLWKKQTVTKEDIQRILAIYELDVSDHHAKGTTIEHRTGPFKLHLAGIGVDARYSIEYVGGGNAEKIVDPPWDEYKLQKLYEGQVQAAFISQRNNPDSWLHDSISSFPRLDFIIGAQTQARKGKASTVRKEILNLSSQAQSRAGSAFTVQTSGSSKVDEVQPPQDVKDRTLSLLDRIKARALANSSGPPQTKEAMLRRYAIGRINEVVEIIRMKQQHKLSSTFVSSVHSSPGKVRGTVSFSMNQLVSDIKGSMAVPMGDVEVRLCIHILAKEIPGIWLSVYNMGSVQSVILNGPGRSGVEIKKMLEEQEKKM